MPQMKEIRAKAKLVRLRPNHSLKSDVDPPRILKRLFSLRGLSHEREVKQIFARGPRTRCSHGAGTSRRVALAVVGR